MTTIKADLHMHGPIGFQNYWLKKQGYENKNLLKEIADSCFRKDIGLTVITSEEDNIPRESIHDRFNWLKKYNSHGLKSDGYKLNSLGNNVEIIKKDGKSLYLINAQTVRVNYHGKNIGLIVVGKNDIENHKDFYGVFDELSRRNDIILGAGYETFKHEIIDEIVDKVDYLEGFNSQMFPWVNWQTKHYAKRKNKSWITVSDAHRIEDAGISFIEFDKKYLNIDSENDFIGSLKCLIKDKKFISHCHYENPINWINWVSKFRKGLKTKAYKE